MPEADVAGIAGDQLRSYVERLERLGEERKALGDDIAEVHAEARGSGFDSKIIKRILKIRAMDQAEFDEQETLLDLYKRALGMLPDGASSAQAAE